MTLIDQLLYAFEEGNIAKMDALITDDFNLRIEHYNDNEADVSLQYSTNRAEFHALLARLAQEVFSKGTQILSLDTQELENGWTLSKFRQKFFYVVRDCDVVGETWILAHEKNGKLDFFREIATPVVNIE